MEEQDIPERALPPEMLEKVPELRRKFGNLFIFEGEGQHFVYRTLTLGEIHTHNYLTNVAPELCEEVLLKAVVLPVDAMEKIDNLGIGTVALLSEQILQDSTVSTIEEILQTLEQQRVEATTAESQMIAFVCAAFPSINPESAYNLTQEILIRYTALAEVVLGKQLQIVQPKKTKRGRSIMAPPEESPPQIVPSSGVVPQTGKIDFKALNRAMGFDGPNVDPGYK